jgi:DNA-binding transcriptional MerR regulator
MTNASALHLRAPKGFVSIAELANRLGVTARTLRHYQDQGLIRSRRIAHNTRAYDADAVATVETIVALRDVDLPIATIRDILALRREPQAQAEALRAALLTVQADKQRQIARIDGMLAALITPAPCLVAPCVEGDAPAPRRLAETPTGLAHLMSGDVG